MSRIIAIGSQLFAYASSKAKALVYLTDTTTGLNLTDTTTGEPLEES